MLKCELDLLQMICLALTCLGLPAYSKYPGLGSQEKFAWLVQIREVIVIFSGTVVHLPLQSIILLSCNVYVCGISCLYLVELHCGQYSIYFADTLLCMQDLFTLV